MFEIVGGRKKWSESGIAQLVLYYPDTTIHIDKLVVSFNRTRNSIHQKANELGLSRDLRRVVTLPETKAKYSEKARLRVGSKNPFYGRKHKPESLAIMKFKLSAMMRGKKNPFYGKKHSELSKRKMSDKKKKMFLGENNPAWRGGYEPYYGPNWKEQRRKALERDGFKCMNCGRTQEENGKELDVHHIIPFRVFGRKRYKEANDLSNLIALCMKCHRKMLRRDHDRFSPSSTTCIHNGEHR